MFSYVLKIPKKISIQSDSLCLPISYSKLMKIINENKKDISKEVSKTKKNNINL